MSSTTDNLLRVMSGWSGIELGEFQGAMPLGGLWDQAHLMTIPYDPQGIDRLIERITEDHFFATNPNAANLERGFFRDGGGIQTEGQLLDFLTQ